MKARFFIAALVVCVIGACGGGGDDTEDTKTPTPSVDCKANPEACR